MSFQREPDVMRKSNHVPPALQTSLTDSQIAWLTAQTQFMHISYDELARQILNEWLSDHPEMLRGRYNYGDITGRALSEFIRRHSAEFLPVQS